MHAGEFREFRKMSDMACGIAVRATAKCFPEHLVGHTRKHCHGNH